jgi:antitoxin component YwqK of YwqJK toxin-antitoxin module
MTKVKWIIGLMIFVGSILNVNAQNITDKQGRKQGAWQKTYPKSKALEYKGTFKDNKPVGVFTYFYPSTKVKAVIRHSETTNQSEAFFYHDNGELMTYGIYQNLKKDSVWLNFGPTGRISYKESYKNDILDGLKTIYFISEDINNKSSKISSMLNYKNGQLDGEFRELFDFGGKKIVGQYKEDEKVGIWEEFHPNGQKQALTRYKNGVRHGWCFAYNEAGKEVNKVYYFNGKRTEGKDLEFLFKQMKAKGVNPNE